ncbi:hypothetical protein FACS1894195_1450 [Bacteroidia bacterium]|nr:hypothetical protein FACS1894195_1450 [Bacteroidia bacterium]
MDSMNIKEMHFDFKQKLNKIDSAQYRNFRVPEIDWKLNDAQDVYIKMIAEPRLRKQYGFESSQRSIDDIRTLVTQTKISLYNDKKENIDVAKLPDDYMYFVSGKVQAKKDICEALLNCIVRQHQETFQDSPFDRSSFIWREINIAFVDGGIKVFTGNDFSVIALTLDYIRRPAFMHNAGSFMISERGKEDGTYTLPSGVELHGTKDCELPEHTHREIVDLAVLITTGDLSSDYSMKQAKTDMTN